MDRTIYDHIEFRKDDNSAPLEELTIDLTDALHELGAVALFDLKPVEVTDTGRYLYRASLRSVCLRGDVQPHHIGPTQLQKLFGQDRLDDWTRCACELAEERANDLL